MGYKCSLGKVQTKVKKSMEEMSFELFLTESRKTARGDVEAERNSEGRYSTTRADALS